MAIIYDICTGAVISAPGAAEPAASPVPASGYAPAAQSELAVHSAQDEPPCTSYMALLQRILKDL